MDYNARNRKAAEEEFEGIGYSIEDEDLEEYGDEDDFDDYEDYDEDSEDDLLGFFEAIEGYVESLKDFTIDTVKKSERCKKALAVSIGVNVLTAAAAVAVCCFGSPKKIFAAVSCGKN
jgi:hypothetical protein